MAEERLTNSKQVADAVFQQLLGMGAVPPYVPYSRDFYEISRVDPTWPVFPPAEVRKVVGLLRRGIFRSTHYEVVFHMHSEEFEYEGGERQTLPWTVEKVKVYVGGGYEGWPQFQEFTEEMCRGLSAHVDDHGCVMYAHLPEKYTGKK